MKRLVYNQLLRWKNDSERKPLIIKGARQVGKTWIMKEFGRCEYENVVYINCDKESGIANLFEDNFDINRIKLGLEALSGQRIKENKTLIIIDEIQEVRKGLASLKYFKEDAPGFHVMVAGSLLGIALHNESSFPVGMVDIIDMYPMNFYEFLLAIGEDHFGNILATKNWQLISAMKAKYTDFIRQYYFVGGMPEAVKSYKKEKDLKKIRRIQNDIIDGYKNDISKHAPKNEVVRINMVLNSISSQLVKENKKYIYGAIKKGARAKEFEVAIQWLIDCGIVYKINRVNKAKIPLKFYEDISSFKLFLLDCGLFGCLSEAPAKEILIGNNIFEEYKGAFTEEYVLQQIIKYDGPFVYYWSRKTSDAELDFLVQYGNKLYPIEVKAEENLRAKSLRSFISKNPDLKGYRISMSDFREEDWLVNIPLCAVSVLFEKDSLL